jgi:hypothetical protein
VTCKGGPALGKRDGDGHLRRRGAMLDGQRQVIAMAAQIEVGIGPGVELGRATLCLPGAGIAGPFPGMMDDKHGNAMLTLQFAQMASSGTTSPLGFSSMRCRWTKGSRISGHGCNRAKGSARLSRSASRSRRTVGASDGLDVAIRERNADGIIDAIEAASHNVQSVFGGVEQHAACSRHCETAQAGDAGGRTSNRYVPAGT